MVGWNELKKNGNWLKNWYHLIYLKLVIEYLLRIKIDFIQYWWFQMINFKKIIQTNLTKLKQWILEKLSTYRDYEWNFNVWIIKFFSIASNIW